MLRLVVMLCLLVGTMLVSAGQEPTVDDLLKQADAAFKKGEHDKALDLATKAIKQDPKSIKAYLFRAPMYKALRKHKEAIADCDAIIKLDPTLPIAYHIRGEEHFKSGNIKESLADFDKVIKLEPKAKASLWQRGISAYYAAQYKEGKEQFEADLGDNPNDVEEAVWRYLCMVPLVGKEKSQKDILKIGPDDRIPMKQVYD